MNSSVYLSGFQPRDADAAGILSWIHIGDLHMTRENEKNDLDFQVIVATINKIFGSSISFLFVPGDVAEDGSRTAYQVVRASLDRLTVPWCAIVGDHDVHGKSFANFLEAMAERTHYAFTAGTVRFIAMNAFDVPDPSSFVVSEEQLAWVRRELQTATDTGQSKVILLHCYPSDLRSGGRRLAELLHEFDVRLIDMGHTHYNEVANDGRILYTATRSTGQIEEGPAGFSVTNLDGGVVSWRFLNLDTSLAVMITSPSDERLMTQSSEIYGKTVRVRAKAWGSSNIIRAKATFAEDTVQMKRITGSQVWEALIDVSAMADNFHALTVTVEDADGKTAQDEIRVAIGIPAERRRVARDQDNALEAWPEHGLLATQLGPNKNGRKW